MRSPVNWTLPGRSLRTSGTWMRRFSPTAVDPPAAGYETLTAAPSGNGGPPSKTTTPLCTRPGMIMQSLFYAGRPETRANRATQSWRRAMTGSPDHVHRAGPRSSSLTPHYRHQPHVNGLNAVRHVPRCGLTKHRPHRLLSDRGDQSERGPCCTTEAIMPRAKRPP